MADQRARDYDAAIRDFKLKLEEYTTIAACGRPYIFVSRLTKWLKSSVTSDDHTTKQANRLRAAAYRHHDQPALPISIEQLCDRCLLVFSILLEMGRGSLIDRFLRHDKVDKDLPIDLLALRRTLRDMKVRNPDELAREFDRLQWRYCPARFEFKMGKDFHENRVIPIGRKEEIKKGGTAQLWQIEVPEEFIDIKLREAVKSSRYDRQDSIGPCYHFALKSFEEGFRYPYINEINAFRALERNAGMVRYLGEYGHKEIQNTSADSEAVIDDVQEGATRLTYNIILEFGDFDLDEYFAAILPPVFQTELESFWKGLFEVPDAVKGIHNLKTNTDGWVQEYNGWHADIKPDNILIVEGKFKLADPGFAKFVIKTDADPMEVLTGGTETYGAPERHPGRRGRLSAVPQTIDTWSLGCVFSIAATWVILGYQGIRQFSKLREKAIDRIVQAQQNQSPDREFSPTLTPGDYFHNGGEVLSDVKNWHEVLRSALRKTDTITGRVLDLVDNKMLKGDSSKRYNAEKICEYLGDIIKETEAEPRLKIPETIMAALLEVDEHATSKATEAVSTETIKGRDQPLTISEERKARKSKLLGTPLMKTTHRSEYLKTELQITTQEGSYFYPGPVPVDHQMADRLNEGSSFGPQSRDVYIQQPGVSEKSPSLQKLPSDSSVATAATHSTHPRKPRTRPSQDVWQAREEIESHTNLFGRPRRDPLLERFYNNRDIKFLVDNAESMTPHWYKASYLLETLLLKATGLDDNGMDLMFTIGSQHDLDGQKGPSKILKRMKNSAIRPSKGMETDMRVSLGEIFAKYLMEAKRKVRSNLPVRNLTVIVLTDGIWAGTKNKDEVRKKIITFIKELEPTIGVLKNRPVSIEFVQFGVDEDATYRLKGLDDDLIYDGIADIIDREPCDGDINKMLLGSFVEGVDQEDVEEPESPETTHHVDSPGSFQTMHGPGRSSTIQNLPSQTPRTSPYELPNRAQSGRGALPNAPPPQDLQRQASIGSSSRHRDQRNYRT